MFHSLLALWWQHEDDHLYTAPTEGFTHELAKEGSYLVACAEVVVPATLSSPANAGRAIL
ncbi:hypothetical protein SCLCIDRAFT_1219316 [Scleroderma citrinum Foug A]|uniref:Uncharacterized protein n=1 Tax=Scleroderma citrinum Foug A TaxID=1036808 RepID=A0A0C3DNQ5_9AGAM|nr:hypothetical protein SCLCIDRAFT_1219316 [Scleroderma citrinum Foug A]